MNKEPLDGVRIGVFGKGGAGKSTVVVLLAAALAEAGYSVDVLGAESTKQLARDLGVQGGGSSVTLLDSRGGFDNAVREAATTVDRVLVVVDPTAAAVRIAHQLAAAVNERVSFVLNRIADPETELYLRRGLEGSRAAVLAVFAEEPAITEQWLRGERIDAPQAAREARTLLCELEGIAPDWDAVPARDEARP